MSIRHKFEILNHCGINVSETAEALYAHWLVVVASGCESDLWRETNVVALVELLQVRHGIAAAKQLNGDFGEVVAVVDPSDDEAIATAATLVPQMDTLHLDEAMYVSALDQAVDEHWGDLEDSERVDLLVTNGFEAALFSQITAPDCLRAILQEDYE